MARDLVKASNRLIRSATLKQQLVDALIDDIRQGKIAPVGSMISAKKLSEELDVSRTPAREAVDTLATLHLVKWVSNSGARVCEIDLPQLIDLMAVRKGVEMRGADAGARERSPQAQGAEGPLGEDERYGRREEGGRAAGRIVGRGGEAPVLRPGHRVPPGVRPRLAGSEDMGYLITYLLLTGPA